MRSPKAIQVLLATTTRVAPEPLALSLLLVALLTSANAVGMINAAPTPCATRAPISSPGDDTSPVWSPDGTKIAWVTDRTGNREVYVMDADTGSNPVNVSANPAIDRNPVWAPR